MKTNVNTKDILKQIDHVNERIVMKIFYNMKVEGDTNDILNKLVTCQNKQLYNHVVDTVSKVDFKFKNVNYLTILYLMQKWLDEHIIIIDNGNVNNNVANDNKNMIDNIINDDGLDGLLIVDNDNDEGRNNCDNDNHEVINEDDQEFLNAKAQNEIKNDKDKEDIDDRVIEYKKEEYENSENKEHAS